MKLLTCLCGLAVALQAQTDLLYYPIMIKDNQAVFGAGKAVGFWAVSAKNIGTTIQAPTWHDVAKAATEPINWEPNALVVDKVTRQVQNSRSAKMDRAMTDTKIAAAIGTGLGILFRIPALQTTGIIALDGPDVIKAGINIFRTAPPNAKPYTDGLVPDGTDANKEVHLLPGQSVIFYVGAAPTSRSYVHPMKDITIDVPLRVAAAAPGAPVITAAPAVFRVDPNQAVTLKPRETVVAPWDVPGPDVTFRLAETKTQPMVRIGDPVMAWDKTVYDYLSPALAAERLCKILAAREGRFGVCEVTYADRNDQ